MKRNFLIFLRVFLVCSTFVGIAYYFGGNTADLHKSNAVKLYTNPSTVVLINYPDTYDSEMTISNFSEGNQYYSFDLEMLNQKHIGKDIEIKFQYNSFNNNDVEEYTYSAPYFDFSVPNLIRIPKVPDTDYLVIESFSCSNDGSVTGYLGFTDLKSKALLYKKGFNKLLVEKRSKNTIAVRGSLPSYKCAYCGVYDTNKRLIAIEKVDWFIGSERFGVPAGARYVKLLDVIAR